MSWLFFASGGQSIGSSVSALDLPTNIRGWFPDSAPSVAEKPFGLLYMSSSELLKALTRVLFETSYTDAGGNSFFFFFFSSKWQVYPDWKSGDKLGGCEWTGISPSQLLILAPLGPWERVSSYIANHCQDLLVLVLQTRLAPVPWTLCHLLDSKTPKIRDFSFFPILSTKSHTQWTPSFWPTNNRLGHSEPQEVVKNMTFENKFKS